MRAVLPELSSLANTINNKTSCGGSFFFPAYNDKVVAFLRQPNIQDILKEKYPTYTSSSQLREKVHRICGGGTEALDKVSNDLQLTIMLR